MSKYTMKDQVLSFSSSVDGKRSLASVRRMDRRMVKYFNTTKNARNLNPNHGEFKNYIPVEEVVDSIAIGSTV